MGISLYDLKNYPYSSRSERLAYLLEELVVECTRVRLDYATKEHKQPEYLAIHPHGVVPAIRDGEVVVFEWAACCLYLADRFAEKGLAPPPGSPERGRYMTLAIYSVSTVQRTLELIFEGRMPPPEKQDAVALKAAEDQMNVVLDALSRALEKPFLLGDRFSAVDAMYAGLLVWADAMGLLSRHPKVVEYLGRLKARPAFARSATAEGSQR
jgi:glutathione S-transferase